MIISYHILIDRILVCELKTRPSSRPSSRFPSPKPSGQRGIGRRVRCSPSFPRGTVCCWFRYLSSMSCRAWREARNGKVTAIAPTVSDAPRRYFCLDRMANWFAPGHHTGRRILSAAEQCAKHKLSTADAIVYATAKLHGADLLTCDRHFENLPNVRFVLKTGG